MVYTGIPKEIHFNIPYLFNFNFGFSSVRLVIKGGYYKFRTSVSAVMLLALDYYINSNSAGAAPYVSTMSVGWATPTR